MKNDYSNDPNLLELLEQLKRNLFNYFHDNYGHMAISTLPSLSSPSVQTAPVISSPKKLFTDQSHRKEKAAITELDKYFKLPTEDFDLCNLIQWWMGQ